MYLFPSALFRTKSICLGLFSAFSGAQACERRIHLDIKFGEQPFPEQKSISLNVSRSPIGFRQKTILMSSGQLFRGKKASPFKVLKRSALSSDTSFLERYLTISRDSCSADIVLECLNSSTSLTMSDYSADRMSLVNGFFVTSHFYCSIRSQQALCRFALFRYPSSKVCHCHYKGT